MSLSVKNFADFFGALHDVEPFPWQTRLLEQVASDGKWPALLDLPTGTGKTAALDVALFHLALEAENGEARQAPLRIVMVVDRRTIVDQADERARGIRQRLREGSGILERVRKRLVVLSGDEHSPLQVTLLRGGMARDDAWAKTPNQPLIALSTVDQVGSRLLFRGYGVSESMRPIHAGLLGNDTLLLLDEVHLSRPFCDTLEAIESRYRTWAEVRLPDRSQFVQMSATPGGGVEAPFRLDSADKKHELLKVRLRAKRPVRLLEPIAVSGGEERRRQSLVQALAHEAASFVEPGKAIAVVVNRVQTARETFAVLNKKFGDAADILLVTGRMRPLERDRLERELRPRVKAGREDAPGAKPVVVVSTQCIEAGADFDFDVMVTECASLDAIRQRFGRLNRLGTRNCQGVLVVRGDAVAKDADPDPIYGSALAATWEHLRALGSEVDFGLAAFPMPEGEELDRLVSPRVEAPTLLPAHLDGWAQTAPAPEPDSEVALWLHGPSRGTPDVQIVWREDLTTEEMQHADDETVLDALVDRLSTCPPSVAEALSVPYHEALAWLTGRKTNVLSDVEGELQEEIGDDEAKQKDTVSRPAVAWRGERTQLVHVAGRRDDAIHPGDTLVVPSSYGGISITHRNWEPDATAPVDDLGEEALLRSRGRAVLRGIPLPEDDGSDVEDVQTARDYLEMLIASPVEQSDIRQRIARLLIKEFRGSRKPRVLRVSTASGTEPTSRLVVIGRGTYRKELLDPDTPADATTDEETSSFTGTAVVLSRHNQGVGARARDFATRCGLPERIVEDLALAGSWHDAGKADRRFQQLLRGGDAFSVTVASEPLAKSGLPPGDRNARQRARARSGLPVGFRHELVSIALMTASEPALREKPRDWELVLHLVASHHGHCRPLAPTIDDPKPVVVEFNGPEGTVQAGSDHQLARLDSGVSQRFWRLVRRYGWHGLAWLEAILRLADHRQSEAEQEEGHTEVPS